MDINTPIVNILHVFKKADKNRNLGRRDMKVPVVKIYILNEKYTEWVNRKLNAIEKYITICKEHYKRDYPKRCQRSNRLKHRKSNSEQSTSELWVSISCTNIIIWNPRRRVRGGKWKIYLN